MAARGLRPRGVIDAGYRGDPGADDEPGDATVELKAGDKIAQMIPVPVLTGLVRK
jgi:dUTP pyrophosphatase